MKALLPVGYFPPISYFAWVLRTELQFEAKEHFVKQTLRNRCTIMGANGPLHLLVPRVKSRERQPVDRSVIHDETDWKKLHWRSLEAAYRNSPYFEYYEEELRPFFEKDHTLHFELGKESIRLICDLLGIECSATDTVAYEEQPEAIDLRSAWNKHEYAAHPPVLHFPSYTQVFSDRFPFAPDLSILDLLFCLGPASVSYLENLKLRAV